MSRAILVLAPFLVVACKSDRDLFEQTYTDTFLQAANNQVDILWVVDDSNSMTEEQDTLVRGFASFASQLQESRTEFQLGVISTSFDYADQLRGVLKGDPPYLTPVDDFEAEFGARAAVGIGGSDKEKGLEAAVYALQPTMTLEGLGGPNEGFVRPDAHLLVIVVSDEEDCSDRGALEGQPADACYADRDALPPVAGFVTDLRAMKDDDSMVQIAAIVGTPGSTCPEQFEGSRYITAAQLTGGLIGDICQSDWEDMLRDLGLNATGVYSQFQLTYAAKPETIHVWVDDAEIPQDPADGWTYDESTWFVSFHGGAVPARDSQITVTYTIQSGVREPSAEAGATSI
jgi:hypothetical protein